MHSEIDTIAQTELNSGLAYRGRIKTPSNLQTDDELGRRRRIVIGLNVVTYIAMMAVAAVVLSSGGWDWIDSIMLVAFAIGLPWTVLGFWNALIGLYLLHGVRDPLKIVAPFAAAGDADTPITSETAVLMTLRNEDAARAIERFRIVQESLDATGHGHQFNYFILSDSNDEAAIAAEESAFAQWCHAAGAELAERIHYRRRTENTGFKAGNIRDFCERWGKDFEFMLPLDADSVMSGDAIVKLVRMMQAISTHRHYSEPRGGNAF